MKVLIVVPLPIDKFEGAMNRVNSAIEMYDRHGYDVYILDIFIIHHLFKLAKYKKKLNTKAHWLFMPSFSWLRTSLFQNISVVIGQLWIFFLTRIHSFDILQFDMHYGGRICKYRNKSSHLVMNYRGDAVDEYLFLHPDELCNSWRIDSLKTDIKISVLESDTLLTVSEKLKETAEKYSGKDIRSFFIMPCCADIARFRVDVKCFKEAYKGRIVVGYCGGMADWQNVDVTIDIVIKLRMKNPQVFFLLVTNGNISSISKQLETLGCENYEHVALAPQEIPYYLGRMDASFILRENRPLNIVASPTKISESLAAGVPIIATQYAGDINDVVSDGENGIILKDLSYSDSDIERIGHYLQKVKQRREYYRDLCHRSVRERTWEQYADKYIHYIQSRIL